MKLLIIQPSWDHSEIVGSILNYCKLSENKLTIIYNWEKPEGNYMDYYLELFDLECNKINYRSPKYHINEFKKADFVIFLDEVHLNKFMSKGIYQEMSDKYFTFNHVSKTIPYNIKILTLGMVPYNHCVNENKYLTNSYFNPREENIKKQLNFGKKKYLIVGTPKYREIEFLKKLSDETDNLEIEINYVIRQDLTVTFSRYVNLLMNVSTEKLIELIRECDYIITLFKKDSVYHQDRISGIIPFAVSFGKPLITDLEFSELIKLPFSNKLTYNNYFLSFRRKILESLKINNLEYEKMVNEIIKYRDIKITEQYLNYHLLFDKI